jgi:uncharacterized protein (TIGR00255 family)
MIHSMTAFARVDLQEEWGALQWELRSVNHRYLEVGFRLPEGARDLEFPLREIVKKRLQRGKVDCRLNLITSDREASLELNRPVLLQLLATLEQLRRDAPEIANPDPLELLRWPGVLGAHQDDTDAITRAVSACFEEAMEALVAHRQREGESLGKLIDDRLVEVQRIVTEVRALTKGLAETQRSKLQARLKDLETQVPAERLEQEIVMAAQRADVAEELDRLETHVREARTAMSSNGPHGRRLDFLTQELNREANTIAAKSALAETSGRAVDLKVIIEQIREQVQNIE